MVREYIVSVTDEVNPDAFQRFENYWSPEQEIVRCGECTHAEKERVDHEIWCPITCSLRSLDWFCADGERR
jgi:hypothetical protein